MNDYFLSSNRCIFLLYSFNFPGAGSIGFLCSVGQNIWPHELRQLSGLPKILNLIDYWGFHKFGIMTNKRNKISWQGWVFWKILWVSHALVVWTCTLCMPVNHKDPKGARLCQCKLHAKPGWCIADFTSQIFCWLANEILSEWSGQTGRDWRADVLPDSWRHQVTGTWNASIFFSTSIESFPMDYWYPSSQTLNLELSNLINIYLRGGQVCKRTLSQIYRKHNLNRQEMGNFQLSVEDMRR